MKIFLICRVRGATAEQIDEQRVYVESLELQGHKVHWPHRDTKQDDPERGTGICRTTFWAIFDADQVHVVYDPTSEGFVADTMMTFVLNELGKKFLFEKDIRRRRVVIVNPDVVAKKIGEEAAQQVARGANPELTKSYTMVLWNLAKDTENL